MSSPFEELYSKLASSKLFEILENGDSYQAEAVEAARIELLRRTLNEKEIDLELQRRQQLREEILHKKEEKKRKLLSQDDIEAYEMALDHPDWELNKIHDIQILKVIKKAVIITSIMALLFVLIDLRSIAYYIRQLLFSIDVFNSFYLIKIICGLVGPFLLHKQMKIGWFISFMFAFAMLFFHYSLFKRLDMEEYTSFSFAAIESLAFIILSLVSVSYLMRKNLRNFFEIKNGQIALSIIGGLILNFGYIWIYLINR